MLDFITYALGLIFAYLIGTMVGFERGWRAGDQSGKLDQHLYNERVNRKVKERRK